MIQVTRTGTVFCGSADDLEDLKIQFDRQHCIRLPQLLEPQLLRLFQHQIDKAQFYERVHEHVVPPPVDLCMKPNKTAASLSFLMNRLPGSFVGYCDLDMRIGLAPVHVKPAFVPLALLYLKAYLLERRGYEFSDIDLLEFRQDSQREEILRRTLASERDVVGLPC